MKVLCTSSSHHKAFPRNANAYALSVCIRDHSNMHMLLRRARLVGLTASAILVYLRMYNALQGTSSAWTRLDTLFYG